MCIAHVMRFKIWYLYISWDVLCQCFLHSFLWNPLLNLPTRFVFNVLHLLRFCAGLSGRLFAVFVVHSVYFFQLFFNSVIPFKTVRTSGISLFWSWWRTLSHFFPSLCWNEAVSFNMTSEQWKERLLSLGKKNRTTSQKCGPRQCSVCFHVLVQFRK